MKKIMGASDETHAAVVTRFAPSPTGPFHVGSARTALFNHLFARKHGGTFLVRSEDTDRTRSLREYEDDIRDGLAWLGLEADAFSRQSERGAIYRSYLEKLIADDTAYISKEENANDPNARSEVIRFRNPQRTITFTDVVRGEITFDTSELGDFVIAKDMDTPLYHLVVVVDDHEMQVSHVIRGEDGISNTPRQILIQEAIGASRPVYAHLPLILAPDRSKLSKRYGDVAVHAYREHGYLPEAMVNFLALLGWNPGDDREFFTEAELRAAFSLERVQKSGAIFDVQKLNWLNRQHIKQLPEAEQIAHVEQYIPEHVKALPEYSRERLERVTPIIIERIAVFRDVAELAESDELTYYFQDPAYDADALLWKHETEYAPTKEYLDTVIERLDAVPESDFSIAPLRDAVWEYAEEKGKGNVLWPMRYALSGKERSPDPFELAAILGKETTLRRLRHARHMLTPLNA